MKQTLNEGKVAIGPQLRFGSPAIAEMFALAGFDFVILDGEHAPQTPIGIQGQLQAIGNAKTTALVRLSRNDLEFGFAGIVPSTVGIECTYGSSKRCK